MCLSTPKLTSLFLLILAQSHQPLDNAEGSRVGIATARWRLRETLRERSARNRGRSDRAPGPRSDTFRHGSHPPVFIVVVDQEAPCDITDSVVVPGRARHHQ